MRKVSLTKLVSSLSFGACGMLNARVSFNAELRNAAIAIIKK